MSKYTLSIGGKLLLEIGDKARAVNVAEDMPNEGLASLRRYAIEGMTEHGPLSDLVHEGAELEIGGRVFVCEDAEEGVWRELLK